MIREWRKKIPVNCENETSVVTHEISVLFLENCENCLFLLYFVSKRRLNVQDNVPDPCLNRMTMMTILNMIQSMTVILRQNLKITVTVKMYSVVKLRM